MVLPVADGFPAYTHVNMWLPLLCTWLASFTNMRRRCHLAGCNYKQFSTYEHLLRHYERRHGHINGVALRCVAETCGFSTKYIKRLREHVESHHTQKERWKIQPKVYESQLFHVQNIGIIGGFFYLREREKLVTQPLSYSNLVTQPIRFGSLVFNVI